MRHIGERPKAREAGFTLIEMMVALMILALAYGVGSATLARRDREPTPAETASQLQAMLLRARSDAIAKATDTALVIHPAERYFIYPPDEPAKQIARNVEIRLLAAGGNLVSGTGRTNIVFRGDGSSSGARIELSDGARPKAMVEVHWLTGLPRLVMEEQQ